MTDVAEEPGVSTETPVRDDRRKRKRRPKPGDVGALRRVLWEALREVETLLSNNAPDIKLKSASTLATLGGVYLKALEVSDIEARIAALEAAKGKS